MEMTLPASEVAQLQGWIGECVFGDCRDAATVRVGEHESLT
jgi:hypothetical protein